MLWEVLFTFASLNPLSLWYPLPAWLNWKSLKSILLEDNASIEGLIPNLIFIIGLWKSAYERLI